MRGKNKTNGRLWTADEERFYGESGRNSRNSLESGSGSTGESGGGKRWKFNDADANFDAGAGVVDKKKKKKKKDRWERTEDAYTAPSDGKKKKKKSKKNHSTVGGDGDMYNHNHGEYDDPDRRSDFTGASTNESEFPEDPEGGRYGRRQDTTDSVPRTGGGGATSSAGRGEEDELAHEF